VKRGMLKIKDIMTKDVITVREDTGVEKICNILIKNKLSGLPVVNNKGDLIGFVSERDIIASVGLADFLNKKARNVMTKKPLSVSMNMPVDEVSRILTRKPYRHLPVVKGKKVIGIISRKDVINRLVGQYY
jgi:CBS domain-containing protein